MILTLRSSGAGLQKGFPPLGFRLNFSNSWLPSIGESSLTSKRRPDRKVSGRSVLLRPKRNRLVNGS